MTEAGIVIDRVDLPGTIGLLVEIHLEKRRGSPTEGLRPLDREIEPASPRERPEVLPLTPARVAAARDPGIG